MSYREFLIQGVQSEKLHGPGISPEGVCRYPERPSPPDGLLLSCQAAVDVPAGPRQAGAEGADPLRRKKRRAAKDADAGEDGVFFKRR